MKIPLRYTAVLTLLGLGFIPTGQADQPDRIQSGDLLIANGEVVVKGRAGIVKVDPLTGVQTVISKGGLFGEPDDVTVGLSGTLYVADSSAQPPAGAVLSVALPTKKQAVVTSGGILGTPQGVAVEASGQLLVTAIGNAPDQIVRVDPQTGAQSVVTMLPGQALRVAVESTGQILVGIASSPPGGEIIRVDPVSGAQSIVSAGGLLTTVWDLAVAPNGDIIVLNRYPEMILRVDPVSGAQSVISSGGLLLTPFGIAVASNGAIFVVDPMGQTSTADGRVIRIDPATGSQTIFSEGQKLVDPYGISVAP